MHTYALGTTRLPANRLHKQHIGTNIGNTIHTAKPPSDTGTQTEITQKPEQAHQLHKHSILLTSTIARRAATPSNRHDASHSHILGRSRPTRGRNSAWPRVVPDQSVQPTHPHCLVICTIAACRQGSRPHRVNPIVRHGVPVYQSPCTGWLWPVVPLTNRARM